MVELILNEMQSIVSKHELNLLTTYPNDLFVHDRENLERFAHAGASLAWVVGHNHTHIVNLGLNSEENEMVRYLTRLSSTDRFYKIKIFGGDAAFTEVSRDEFCGLASTPVPYNRMGTDNDFVLFKRGQRVGHVLVSTTGSFRDRVYNLNITAESSATNLDKAALQLWAGKAAAHIAGSLFIKTEMQFQTLLRRVEFA